MRDTIIVFISAALFTFGYVENHTWAIWAGSGVLVADLTRDLIHRKG